MNFKDNSNATEFLKGIREGKDNEYIKMKGVIFPVELLGDVYFRSPVEDLLSGKHASTGDIDAKMKYLKDSIVEEGWVSDTKMVNDRIFFEWEEGRFRVCNGQHRLVLIAALGIPYFLADITLNYDVNDQFETLAAFDLSDAIENFQPKDFNTTFTQEDLDKTQDLYQTYMENKPKRKWYQFLNR